MNELSGKHKPLTHNWSYQWPFKVRARDMMQALVKLIHSETTPGSRLRNVVEESYFLANFARFLISNSCDHSC